MTEPEERARTDAVIDSVTAAAYRIPTDRPEADGTLSWNSTTLVVAEVTGAGVTGWGYTYGAQACVPVIRGVLADAIRGGSVLDIPLAWTSMVRALRNIGRQGVAGCALSAVDTALWDLKARAMGIPLADLFGRARGAAPVYGSGGFVTYDEPTARDQLEHWTGDLRIPRVKIKIGQDRGGDVRRDLERVAFARHVIGPDVDLFVDANGAYRRKQAVRVGRQLAESGVTWFEEPVSSDDLAGLRLVCESLDCDVAAGEYGYDLAYFGRMVAAGAVDCLQIDVTRCGGYSEWLRVAALAAAHGLEVSAHCAPSLHLPVALAAENLRHIEYFHDHVRIEEMVFDGVVRPVRGVLNGNGLAPGHGLTVKRAVADAFRVA